jgi:hypothetical protein
MSSNLDNDQAKLRAKIQTWNAPHNDPQTYAALSEDMQKVFGDLWSIMYSYGGFDPHITQACEALNTFVNTGSGTPNTVGELSKALDDIDNE